MIDNTDKSLSSAWNSVRKEDIGSGFRRAATAVQKEILRRDAPQNGKDRKLRETYHRLRIMNAKAEHSGVARHPFLNGKNRFIFYVLKPPPPKKRVDKRREQLEKKVTNYKNKVTPQQRAKFNSDLEGNIDRTSKFFLTEILPRTQSLYSALDKVDEVMSQLADTKSEIPLDFIKGKIVDATRLRIIRFLCQQYGLTKEESRLMAAEYIARTKPQLF